MNQEKRNSGREQRKRGMVQWNSQKRLLKWIKKSEPERKEEKTLEESFKHDGVTFHIDEKRREENGSDLKTSWKVRMFPFCNIKKYGNPDTYRWKKTKCRKVSKSKGSLRKRG